MLLINKANRPFEVEKRYYSMVIEPLTDNQYTIAATEQPYDGASSASQQQLTMYDYSLSEPQFFPLPITGSGGYLSGVVTSPGVCNVDGSLGQNEIQIAAGGSPEQHRIRSNNALHYISQMLMEDIDERVGVCQGEAALQAAEKSFHDILGQVYPPTTNSPPLHSNNESDGPDKSNDNRYNRLCSTSFSNDCSSYNTSSSYIYGRSLFLPNGPLISAGWTSRFGLPALQFGRGIEAANKFAPSIDKLVIDLGSDRLSISKLTTKAKVGEKSKYAIFAVMGQRDLDILEGGSSKHHAITTCAIIRNENFDAVLLCYPNSFDETTRLREKMSEEASKNSWKGHIRRKLWRTKQLRKEVVDLRTLLVHCAQFVAADDRLLASELLKKIRQHSSADGDCDQRLAFYFADGLEARLAGNGSQVYRDTMARQTSSTDFLKAHSLSLASCPFDRASYYFGNQTILDVLQGQPRVHIVDFGICFGFRWPSLIQRLAEQEEVVPKLRITGIDVPRPGFRPCEMIEETGKLLADYANMFKVPFQYQGIAASRWETIEIEDLNIDEDEVLIINCMFRMKNLGDEIVAINSARDRVLKTMRRMKPKVFILGIVNGSHSSPFFMTRFKEILLHYSSMFDMLDANVPRDNEVRKMMERGLFGQDALNMIACEGAERTERPESYGQWQARCLKAGFEQLPVNPVILKTIVRMNNLLYREDFFADEDSGWLLQGWKGRVLYAMSTWKPNESYDDQ